METTVRVFVVEDDFIIQETLQVALQNGGYEVATASSGEEAVAMLEAEAPDIRVLITDVNLSPGKLTGWDVAKRARELKPDVPIVYINGPRRASRTACSWRSPSRPPRPSRRCRSF